MTETPKKPQRILPPAPPPPGTPARPAMPVPAAGGPEAAKPGDDSAARKPDPTRFGDWEKNGRCIDF